MVEFLEGVRAQPANLAASREVVRETLRDLDVSVLRNGTSVILGIGASGHAAAGYAARLRERGARAYAVSSGDGAAGAADCYLALSYSGRSTETVELLARIGEPGSGGRLDRSAGPGAAPAPAPAAGGSGSAGRLARSGGSAASSAAGHGSGSAGWLDRPAGSDAGHVSGSGLAPGVRIGVTGHAEAPLARVVDHLVPLGEATDARGATLSYTATVQALGMLTEAAWDEPARIWAEVPDHAAAVLADASIGDRIASAFAGVSCVDAIGAGPRAGSAGAAALLLREAAHLPAAAYSLREYLHGPLEIAGPGRGALIFGEGRAVRLAAEMAAWGSPTVLVTTESVRANELSDPVRDQGTRDRRNPTSEGAPYDGPSVRPPAPVVVRLPELPGPAVDVLDILPVQLAAAELAERAGLAIELVHMPADTKLSDGAR